VGCIIPMSVEPRDDTGADLPMYGCYGFSGPTAGKLAKGKMIKSPGGMPGFLVLARRTEKAYSRHE